MVVATQLPGGVVHELPADFAAALKSDGAALATWDDITPLARNEWICWVEDAKKPETRQKRIRWVAKTSAKASAARAAGRAASIGEARQPIAAGDALRTLGSRLICCDVVAYHQRCIDAGGNSNRASNPGAEDECMLHFKGP